MIGVLAFNTIKTFKAARINLLKQVGIEKAFMIFLDYKDSSAKPDFLNYKAHTGPNKPTKEKLPWP